MATMVPTGACSAGYHSKLIGIVPAAGSARSNGTRSFPHQAPSASSQGSRGSRPTTSRPSSSCAAAGPGGSPTAVIAASSRAGTNQDRRWRIGDHGQILNEGSILRRSSRQGGRSWDGPWGRGNQWWCRPTRAGQTRWRATVGGAGGPGRVRPGGGGCGGASCGSSEARRLRGPPGRAGPRRRRRRRAGPAGRWWPRSPPATRPGTRPSRGPRSARAGPAPSPPSPGSARPARPRPAARSGRHGRSRPRSCARARPGPQVAERCNASAPFVNLSFRSKSSWIWRRDSASCSCSRSFSSQSPIFIASLLSSGLWHPRGSETTARPNLWIPGELAREPPDVAAEGEVAEAGSGVDQEMGDDQGGGAAAELVDAAEEQAEGEVAEEAAEALVEVVGAAEEGAGPQGLGRGPAELVEAAQQVAADDHLLEQAAAGGGQEQDGDRPPVAGGGDRDHGAVDAEADGEDVDADADRADHGGQADPPAQVGPGPGGVQADAGRGLAGAVEEVQDQGHRDQGGGQVEQLVDEPDVGEQGRLDPADGRREQVDQGVERRGGQRQEQDQQHLVPQHPPPGQGREGRPRVRGGRLGGFVCVHGTTLTASARLDFMNRDFMGALSERVLVFDGAMGTMLQNAGLSLDDYQGKEGCSEILCVTRPDVVKGIHAAYFEAGADAVETNSFGSSAIVLAEYDIADQVVPLNRLAARLAREVADDFQAGGRPRWVAGSVGPGTKLPTLGHTTYDVLAATYDDQAFGLLEGGADLLLIETCQDLLQVKAAVAGAFEGMKRAGRRVPLITQVTVETTGQMLLGSDIAAALTAIEPLGVDVIGMNCATGPAEMGEHLRHLSQHARTALSCLPNAGLPELRDGRPWYPLTPAELAEAHARFVAEFGLSVVGGCCGTTPEHIRQVVDALGGHAPVPREPSPEPSLASLYQAVPLDQDTTYLTVGERCNANGSRQFRELLLAGDTDGMG